MLLSLLLLSITAAKSIQEGQLFRLQLSAGESVQLKSSLSGDVSFLLRPIESEDLADTLESAMVGFGELEIQYSGTVIEDTIDQYFQSALFLDSDKGQLIIKCIQEPCKGTITGFEQKPINLKKDQNITLSDRPSQLFYIEAPTDYQRIVAEFKQSKIIVEIFLEEVQILHGEVETVVAFEKACSDCKIYGILTSDSLSQIEIPISLNTYTKDIELKEDQVYPDYLFKKNYYHLAIPSIDSRYLEITISGQPIPQILAHIDKRPKAATGYQFSNVDVYDIAGDIKVLFSAQDLKGSKLYLLLQGFGHILIQYQILDSIPTLHESDMVMAFLGNQSKQTFKFELVPNTALEILVEPLNGIIPKISAKHCDNECTVDETISENDDQLLIDAKCNTEFCNYQLTVSAEGDLGYLLGSRLQNIPQLILNKPLKNYIVEGEIQEYILKYDKQPQDEALSFLVNSHNVYYLVSSDKKCRPIKSECADHHGGSENILTLRGKKLKSTNYRIAVIGRMTGMFTITAHVLNSDHESIIELAEDTPHRGILRNQEGFDIAYFRIKVGDSGAEIIDVKNPSFEFSIRAAAFKLAIVVNVGDKLPSLDDFQLVSFKNYLQIKESQEEYLQQGVYTVGVQIIDKIESEISFTIVYTTSRTVKTLDLGEVFLDYLPAQAKKLYSFHTAGLVDITLTKKNNITMSLGAEINSTDVIAEQHSSTLSLTKDNMVKLCGDHTNLCQIYIRLENLGNKAEEYSIRVWDLNQPIELHDGQVQLFNFQSLQNTIKLFYYPISHEEDVQVIISSLYGEVSLKIIIQDQDESEIQTYQDSYKNLNTKSISASAFSKCKPHCQILIEMQSKTIQDPLLNRTVEYDDTVSIIVSQAFIPLGTEPIELTIGDKPRLFIHPVGEYRSDPAYRFKISVHEEYGKAQICLSFSDDTNLYMPDIQNCQFAVQGKVIEMSGSEIDKILTDLNLKENPFVIIALYTKSPQAKVKISLETASDKIQLGTPSFFKLDTNDSKEFQFFNIYNESLYIKVNRFNGVGFMKVEVCSNNLNGCKRKLIQDDHFQVGQGVFVIDSANDTIFCTHCTYYFTFETKGLAIQGLFIITTQSTFIRLSHGITFTDYIEQGELNYYRVAFDTDHQIEILVKDYIGQTEMLMSFAASLNPNDYSLGPYNLAKYSKTINQTVSYYEAIIPPRAHLEDNADEYKVSPYNHPNHTLAGHFNEDDLFIVIRSQKQSNYSITITQSETGIGSLLQDGVMSQCSLSKANPSGRFYYYHQYGNPPELIIKVQPQTTVLDPSSYIKVVVKNDTNETTLTVSQIYDQQVTYKMPNLTGLLTIDINSLLSQNQDADMNYIFDKSGNIQPLFMPFRQYQFSLNYLQRIDLEISMNSKDVNLIASDSIVMTTVKDGKYFETFIPINGRVAIQLSNCKGNLQFAYSQNYQEFLNMEYSSNSSTYEGSTTDFVINVNRGPMYLALTNDEAEDSIFKMNFQVYNDKDVIPHKHYIIPNQGRISTTIDNTDPDNITVLFAPLACQTCDMLTEQSTVVTYKITWSSQEEYLNIVGKCGAYAFQDFSKANQSHYGQQIITKTLLEKETISQLISVEQQYDNNDLFLSIVASVSQNGRQNYEMYYENLHIQMPKNFQHMYKHKFRELIIVSIIFGLFAISMYFINLNSLICLCSFYRRLRQVKKENLNLELTNKMNQLKQEQSGQQPQQTYGELQEENKDEDDL